MSKADPVFFRVQHLPDERAIAVLKAVAELARWGVSPAAAPAGWSSGQDAGFVHYDNATTHAAVVVRVLVERATGRVRVPEVAVAHDCGLIVNPDGVRSQIEGNVVQAISRVLLEEVQFGASGVTSLDWAGYQILRFNDVPDNIAITLINRLDKPMVGAGEAAGAPVAAAIATAIFKATPRQLRALPFTPQRVLAALA